MLKVQHDCQVTFKSADWTLCHVIMRVLYLILQQANRCYDAVGELHSGTLPTTPELKGWSAGIIPNQVLEVLDFIRACAMHVMHVILNFR